MNSAKLSPEQKADHLEMLKIVLQIQLSVQKISGQQIPKVQIGDKEELKNQQVTKDSIKKVSALAQTMEKINTSSIVTGNSMRDGLRKKLVDLITSEEKSELRKSQGQKVALDIED